MPKYLFEISYTAQGARGLLAQGGSARRAAIAAGIEQAGGKLEAFYFAFGGTDAYVIAEHEGNVTAAAQALAVAASGAATVRTVVLLTPEELDAASERDVSYTPPGS
ncbi:MAG: GYD domain-containing protein [Solirubrobacteraceae bacterium]|jgi:uncharacterized protein with GYD domain